MAFECIVRNFVSHVDTFGKFKFNLLRDTEIMYNPGGGVVSRVNLTIKRDIDLLGNRVENGEMLAHEYIYILIYIHKKILCSENLLPQEAI